MNNDFFTYTGWLFGLLSLIFGIFQWYQKNECKKKLEGKNKFSIRNAPNSQNYQAQEQNIKIENHKK